MNLSFVNKKKKKTRTKETRPFGRVGLAVSYLGYTS